MAAFRLCQQQGDRSRAAYRLPCPLKLDGASILLAIQAASTMKSELGDDQSLPHSCEVNVDTVLGDVERA